MNEKQLQELLFQEYAQVWFSQNPDATQKDIDYQLSLFSEPNPKTNLLTKEFKEDVFNLKFQQEIQKRRKQFEKNIENINSDKSTEGVDVSKLNVQAIIDMFRRFDNL